MGQTLNADMREIIEELDADGGGFRLVLAQSW
jgi:hypothetical protein